MLDDPLSVLVSPPVQAVASHHPRKKIKQMLIFVCEKLILGLLDIVCLFNAVAAHYWAGVKDEKHRVYARPPPPPTNFFYSNGFYTLQNIF